MYTLVSETHTDNAQLLLYDFEIRCDNGRLFPILGNWKPSRGRLQQLISPFENSLKYVKSSLSILSAGSTLDWISR